jgi:hypothetical protein
MFFSDHGRLLWESLAQIATVFTSGVRPLYQSNLGRLCRKLVKIPGAMGGGPAEKGRRALK